jgi:hypothetical protein
MNDTEGPAPERYREVAARLRELAEQAPVQEIQADLMSLAARFDLMAVRLEERRESGGTREEG